MAEFDFDDLKKNYDSFRHPVVTIEIAGNEFGENKYGLAVSDIRVELSAGFEASMATFVIYNVYDRIQASFVFDRFKKYVLLGSSVVMHMGYGSTVKEVFRGFIAKVNFIYDEDDIPGVMITAMDIKGIMMTNNSAKQLTAKTYSGALSAILAQEPYVTLMSEGVFKTTSIKATPDGQQGGAGGIGGAAGGMIPGASDAQGAMAGAGGAQGVGAAGGNLSSDTYTVEMVGESDYEFFVRAAKRFNYDFFVLSGELIFRPAKSDTSTYMSLGPDSGLRNINVEYDITGLYGKVEVRNVDPGKGKVVSSSKKFSNKISQGSKAKSIVSKLEKVYIDPTVETKNDAGYRANYLIEDMSYRFGTLEADVIGLPELVPGRFISITGLGKDVENVFYLQEVIHSFTSDGEYKTKLIGKAATITDDPAGAIGGGLGGVGDIGGSISNMGGGFF